MFISNEEKRYLFDQIKALAREQSSAASEITFLRAKIKALEANKKADGAIEAQERYCRRRPSRKTTYVRT